MDKGPWKARYDAETREVYIESDDFTHDVTLTVNGDFRNWKEKLKYAEELAEAIRADAEAEVKRLREMVASNIDPSELVGDERETWERAHRDVFPENY